MKILSGPSPANQTPMWESILQFTAFAAILFGVKLWIIGSFGNATPFWDQWGAEAERLYRPFLEGTLTWGDLIRAHNEHRILTTRLLALMLLVLNGTWNPLLQMVVNAALHIAVLALTVLLLYRVTGQRLALLAFTMVMFAIPYAWENILAGFQAQFYLVLLFSVAALWLCVVCNPLSLGWWAGVVCAILAFFSLASGVLAAAAAALVGMLWLGVGVRRDLRQIVAVSVLIGLCAAGIVLTPSIPGHETLKATSPAQFLGALETALSWPMPQHLLAAIARNLPCVAFAVLMLRRRPPAGDARWFLFALALWSLMPAASIAYGRATGSLDSRYLDLFALALLVNFACLLALVRELETRWRSATWVSLGIWTALMGGSLAMYAVKRLPTELATKREQGAAQEINLRSYLDTGRFEWLTGKPALHVPFPSPERLASILSSSQIRAILPSNVRPSLKPTSVDGTPSQSFVPGGFYPTTPSPLGFSAGSYAAQGDAATGSVSVRFDAHGGPGLLSLPVAGYPLNDGIKVELEQGGQRRGLLLNKNPKESWALAYARVDGRPFSVVLTDPSSSTWVAIGAPRLTRSSELFVNRLLELHYAFLLLGLFLAAFATPFVRNALSIRLPALGRGLSAISRPRAVFGALLIVAVFWFGTSAAMLLATMVAWHAALIALPMACATMIALKQGVRDPVLLAAFGLVGGGFVAFVEFWIWMASPTLGVIAAVGALLASAAILARMSMGIDRQFLALTSPLGIAAGVWVLYGLFVIALALAPSGLELPLNSVASRFTHALPIDNQLSYILAQQVAAGRVAIPMVGDWLSSDRPPLQAAYFLASGASLLPRSDLHYQVQSTLLQALWVFGLWLTLSALRLPARSIFLAMLVCMFSGFALVHGAFTWPKLLPVAYIGAVAAILMQPGRAILDDWRAGLAVGAASALALLSHGSSIFALIGLVLTALVLRRIPSARFILGAVLAGVILMVPWSLYQAMIDPPGNRLMKWHLAGVVPIDSRSFLETLRDSYAALSAQRIFEHKVANLAAFLGDVGKWPVLMAKAVAGRASDAEAAALRGSQFFHLASALGFWMLALAALLARRAWRSVDFRASALLVLLSAMTALVWSIAMFGPGTTWIHQGSLALLVFATAGCVLALLALSPAAAYLVALLQLVLTFVLYVVKMPVTVEATLTGIRAFDSLMLLAAVAFFTTLVMLWKLSNRGFGADLA